MCKFNFIYLFIKLPCLLVFFLVIFFLFACLVLKKLLLFCLLPFTSIWNCPKKKGKKSVSVIFKQTRSK